MTESQYVYRQRKEREVCTHCGSRPPVPNHVECEICLKAKNIRQRRYYAANKSEISARESQKRIERKAEAIKTGMCSRCFIRPADKGYKTCWRCRANNNDGKPRKRSELQKAKAKENAKARRERRIAAHICIRCGKRPARERFKDCGICAAKVNRRRRELRYQRGQSIPTYMRGNGIYCKMCCKPKCNGEKLCDECRDKARKSIAKANEANSIHGGWGTLDFRKIKYEVKPT